MMEKRYESKENQKGGELKRRLRGVRKRKQVQQRLGQDAAAFEMRLVRARRRVGR